MTANYRALPQLGRNLFLTGGGIETDLIFDEGRVLPHFAAFHLLRSQRGREALVRSYRRYAAIAKACGAGFILESQTWRASADWGSKLGYSRTEMARINFQAIALMHQLRAHLMAEVRPIVVSGCVGPRGDGYDPGEAMTVAEAEHYHAHQIAAFARANPDMVTAIAMTNTNETVGIARAAQRFGLQVAISFAVETDGHLPTGHSLAEAIDTVDAATRAYPAYYMINCARPTHFASSLRAGAGWTQRIRGIRANASKRSRQELNEAPDLDAGGLAELARAYAEFFGRHPQITVLGGCWGTDHRRIEHISQACLAPVSA
ncbi:MAG: homocysteine S-methyltransferase family protein [Hyphomicrobiaceae bacterium]